MNGNYLQYIIDNRVSFKISFPDSSHPAVSYQKKNPDCGHFISLDGMNSIFSFNK